MDKIKALHSTQQHNMSLIPSKSKLKKNIKIFLLTRTVSSRSRTASTEVCKAHVGEREKNNNQDRLTIHNIIEAHNYAVTHSNTCMCTKLADRKR